MQQNYEEFGVWGEVFTRKELKSLEIVGLVMWIFVAVILIGLVAFIMTKPEKAINENISKADDRANSEQVHMEVELEVHQSRQLDLPVVAERSKEISKPEESNSAKMDVLPRSYGEEEVVSEKVKVGRNIMSMSITPVQSAIDGEWNV